MSDLVSIHELVMPMLIAIAVAVIVIGLIAMVLSHWIALGFRYYHKRESRRAEELYMCGMMSVKCFWEIRAKEEERNKSKISIRILNGEYGL